MEKENVDNLFRDTLDDFAQNPDPKVWDRIQVSLDQKAQRKRRVIPLWWQLGGVAAALALILFLSLPGAESDPSVPANEDITTTSSEINPSSEESEELNLSKETQGELTEVNKTSTPTTVGTGYALPPSNEVAVTVATSATDEKSTISAKPKTEVYSPITKSDPAVAQIDSDTDTRSEDLNSEAPLASEVLSTEEEIQGIPSSQSTAVAEVQEE